MIIDMDFLEVTILKDILQNQEEELRTSVRDESKNQDTVQVISDQIALSAVSRLLEALEWELGQHARNRRIYFLEVKSRTAN